ncbi:DUF721 domain-containing protein [Hyphomonas sp.]|uniref:DUF721 domain-containing protein n=1 Tax=Hyphomonas sp. TaxID=87 RepID=UPI00391A16CA
MDPIAEAQARVKLRYSRAKPVRMPARSLSLSAERVTRKAGSVRLAPLKYLQIHWRQIAGEQIWRWSQPEKITASKDGRVLTLTVLPQAAPLIQHQSETIRQRISVAAGGDITRIRIVQGTVRRTGPGEFQRRARSLTAAETAHIAEKAAPVADLRLRAAIVALGEAVLSATE